MFPGTCSFLRVDFEEDRGKDKGVCGDLWGPQEMRDCPEHWGLGVGETYVKEGHWAWKGGFPGQFLPVCFGQGPALGPVLSGVDGAWL